MAFTTSTKVKAYLEISGATHDTIISQLINEVDDIITKETNIPTGSSIPTISNEIVDSDGTLRIQALNHPIASIVKVERRDSNRDWEDYPDETHASMEFNDAVIHSKYVVAVAGERQIRLNYTAGYATASVPDDLVLAATLLVVTLFHHRHQIGFKNQNILGLSLVMDEYDYQYVRKILKKYKLVYAI